MGSTLSMAFVFSANAALADATTVKLGKSEIANSSQSDNSLVEISEELSLRDLLAPESNFFDRIRWRAQGQTQGAGTPNRVVIGAFAPFHVTDRWLPYADFELGVNLADREGLSSIVNTKVSGPTLSTSTRLGLRHFVPESKWMFGFNVGYDSRPIDSGDTTEGFDLDDSQQNVFFQQLAAQLDIANDSFLLRPYILYPIGDTEQRLNRFYMAGALQTYGVDLTHRLTDHVSGTVGYYYQQGDLGTANGSGIASRLEIEVLNGLYFNATYTYDPRYESRLSGGFKYVFNHVDSDQSSLAYRAALEPPTQRQVRVHDSWKEMMEKKFEEEENHPWQANNNVMKVFAQNNCKPIKKTKQFLCRLLVEDANGSKKYQYFWGDRLIHLWLYMMALPQEKIDALIAGNSKEGDMSYFIPSKCSPLKSYDYTCGDTQELGQLFSGPNVVPLKLTAAQEFADVYNKVSSFVLQQAAFQGLDYVSNGVLSPHGLIKYGWRGINKAYDAATRNIKSLFSGADKEELVDAVNSAEEAVAESAAEAAAEEATTDAVVDTTLEILGLVAE